jgi:glucose-1-phosphate thymidylyltransferase
LLESNRLVLEKLDPEILGRVDAESRVEGRVVIQAGASIVGSHVRGPAIIGERTTVTSSYVGPYTAIGNDCEIVDSELDHSVVLEGSRITGVPRIVDSLIGKHVEVTRSGQRPHATRLMLGDHSAVDLQ